MKWENLTTDMLAQERENSDGVCVIPLGCTERHGHHLPLGTDTFINRVIMEQAEKLERFVVFPEYTFTQTAEAKGGIGTICVDPKLCFAMLENLCDEIARTGFNKIVLANGHGGNISFANYFSQAMLGLGKPYAVFVVDTWTQTPEQEKYIADKYGVDPDPGHADRDETSLVMSYNDQLVKMDRFIKEEAVRDTSEKWLEETNTYTAMWWAVSYKYDITGDASLASKELGDELCKIHGQNLANQIKNIKQSKILDKMNDFYKNTKNN